MEHDQALTLLTETAMGKRLVSIQHLYKKLDHAQARFKERFCIRCKDGCGSCCEHFNPDITTLEADYVAFGLIFKGEDEAALAMLHSVPSDSEYCPLYRKDNPFHCSIYDIRPLICRLFGASAVKDKNGDPAFKDCRWNSQTLNLKTEDLKAGKDDLVLMSDYGLMLEELQPEDTKTYPLAEAIEKSIYKIRFLIQLSSDPESAPEPEPNAS